MPAVLLHSYESGGGDKSEKGSENVKPRSKKEEPFQEKQPVKFHNLLVAGCNVCSRHQMSCTTVAAV